MQPSLRGRTRPAADYMPESESAHYSLSVKVEYHAVLEYRLKLGSAMPTRRKRPDPAEDATLDQPRGKRQRQSGAASPRARAHVAGSADLIDLIDGPSGAEAGGGCVEVADEGVDHQDETSSIASGPSQLSPSHSPTSRPETPLDLCAACQKLYKRTRRMKGALKNKLLNTDPDSLECHMWVLIKARRPRRPPAEKRDLVSIVPSIKQTPQLQTASEAEACSRPRALLQRNLRKVKAAAKKEKKKDRSKRARGGGAADVAPQRHSPPTVAQEDTQPEQATVIPRAPTRFEKLLSQMHRNRSTIIRESKP